MELTVPVAFINDEIALDDDVLQRRSLRHQKLGHSHVAI